MLTLSRWLTFYHVFYLSSLEKSSRQKNLLGPQTFLVLQRNRSTLQSVSGAPVVMALTCEAWDWLAVIQLAPLLTLSQTMLASSICCGRERCPCCSLSNDLLLTNTQRTSNYFIWQEQQPSLVLPQSHRHCCKLQTSLSSQASPPSQHKHLHLCTNWRNNTDERRAVGFSIGYSVGTQSNTDVSFILLWLLCGFSHFDLMQLILISHRALDLTDMCETLPQFGSVSLANQFTASTRFWHCAYEQL